MKQGITGSLALIGITIILFTLAAASFSADDFRTIDTKQLHAMVVDNAYSLEGGRGLKFIIVDFRTKEEFDKAHIASAINVPERELEKFSTLLPGDKGALIVLYGNDGSLDTSRKWAGKAEAAGYTDIIIYSGTLEMWRQNHLPTAP